MDPVALYTAELTNQFAKLDALVAQAMEPQLSEYDRERLQAEQMALIMTGVPRARANLRIEMERAGQVHEDHAIVPKLEMKGSDEEGWVCTFNQYLIGDDLFWNSAPLVMGRGFTPSDARSDFWIAWKGLGYRRHHRGLKLREVGRAEFNQRLHFAQVKSN